MVIKSENQQKPQRNKQKSQTNKQNPQRNKQKHHSKQINQCWLFITLLFNSPPVCK